MWRRALIRVALAAAGAACEHPPGDPPPSRWRPEAIASAESLAGRIRDRGRACAELAPYDFAAIARSHERRGLPVPAALASCTGEGDEDLEIAVFVSNEATSAFVEAKRKMLCATAAAQGVRFPGFHYVDGGSWVVQPDRRETADELGRLLDAPSRFAACEDGRPPDQ